MRPYVGIVVSYVLCMYNFIICMSDVSTIAKRRISIKDTANLDASTIILDSHTDYILEVDLEVNLEYPQHDRYIAYLSAQRDKSLGKRKDKLLAILYNKQYYIIHSS